MKPYGSYGEHSYNTEILIKETVILSMGKEGRKER